MDTTIAWRLCRAASEHSPHACIHALPGPAALNAFIAAVRPLIDPKDRPANQAIASLAEAVGQFDALIAQIPSKRRGLNALIEGTNPEAKDRGIRTASQGAFRAFSQLLGSEIEGNAIATIVLPPQQGATTCDILHVRVMERIRRLRDGAPIALCSTPYPARVADRAISEAFQTLAGEPFGDARDLIMEGESSPDLPPLDTRVVAGASVLVLPIGSPPATHAATIALGYRSNGVWSAWRSASQSHNWGSYRYSVPSRHAVNDLILHRSLWGGGLPEVLTHLQGSASDPPTRDRLAFELTELPLGIACAPAQALDESCHAVEISRVPTYGRAVHSAMRSAGLDPREFVMFRAKIEHPVPMMTLTWWCPLRDAPA